MYCAFHITIIHMHAISLTPHKIVYLKQCKQQVNAADFTETAVWSMRWNSSMPTI